MNNIHEKIQLESNQVRNLPRLSFELLRKKGWRIFGLAPPVKTLHYVCHSGFQRPVAITFILSFFLEHFERQHVRSDRNDVQLVNFSATVRSNLCAGSTSSCFDADAHLESICGVANVTKLFSDFVFLWTVKSAESRKKKLVEVAVKNIPNVFEPRTETESEHFACRDNFSSGFSNVIVSKSEKMDNSIYFFLSARAGGIQQILKSEWFWERAES